MGVPILMGSVADIVLQRPPNGWHISANDDVINNGQAYNLIYDEDDGLDMVLLNGSSNLIRGADLPGVPDTSPNRHMEYRMKFYGTVFGHASGMRFIGIRSGYARTWYTIWGR